MKFNTILEKIFPASVVLAHCDVPCGIYETGTAKLAAETVLKMMNKIRELPTQGDDETVLIARNNFVRMVATKEEYASLCKEQLLILWTDFFKSEHLETFPDLHETFWKAAKLCSKAKQTVDIATAEELLSAVGKIEAIFSVAKATAKK